jgi:ferredoxin
MPEKTERLLQNVAGAYYVDSSCIDCDMCRTTAPNVFKRDEDIGMSFAFYQPVTAEEIAIAEEARKGCPTESIGNDGLAEPSPALLSPPTTNCKC